MTLDQIVKLKLNREYTFEVEVDEVKETFKAVYRGFHEWEDFALLFVPGESKSREYHFSEIRGAK